MPKNPKLPLICDVVWLMVALVSAKTLDESGKEQAVRLEIYNINVTEFTSKMKNFTDVILSKVTEICKRNIGHCKPVISTSKNDYFLYTVSGYPQYLPRLSNHLFVAFYVGAKEEIFPREILFTAVRQSKTNISNALGYQVGDIGRLQYKSNKTPPTGRSSLDQTLFTIMGAFIGLVAFIVIVIGIVCCMGRRYNNGKVGEQENEVTEEDVISRNAWTNEGAKT